MATKIINGVLKDNIVTRNMTLKRNEKYRLFNGDLPVTVGGAYELYDREKKRPESEGFMGIIDYTYNNETDYSRDLNLNYGRDVNTLGMYVMRGVKPSYRVNNYEGMGDYLSYMGEVYGREMSYAGHLMGLAGLRQNAENLAYDIFPDMEGKTFADYINEIHQYTDVKYAMERDSVGIVKDINVSNALKGVITTNINNYSGKDSRLGTIGNLLYAQSLMNGAQFNSMRRTKYITENLEKLYGNNLSNVYNLSSLFAINPETGRIPDVDSESYIQEIEEQIVPYLASKIQGFQIPSVVGPWQRGYHKNAKYFGTNETVEVNNGIEVKTYRTESDSDFAVRDIRGGKNKIEIYNEEDTYDGSSSVDKNTTVNTVARKRDGLFDTTNRLFREKKINSIVARYYNDSSKEATLTESAVHPEAGVSRGRNLLTKEAWKDFKNAGKNGGYTNPYCRVWTNHHQYSKMTDLIRPFTSDNGEDFMGIDGVQKNWNAFRNYIGPDRLAKYGVVNKNGMVNITPSKASDVDVKQCMFSIENLAWKDINLGSKPKYKLLGGKEYVDDFQNVLSEEQQGPNGGRIMWFPPYDIDFQENVSVNWDSANFIGRGEPVYTYTNTKRSGTLSFTMLVDNPAILNYWMLDKKNNATEDDEQELLRFFAGCGAPIDPNENITKLILNGEYEGGDVNIDGVMPEKDIIFNVYYPNNYSGKDESNAWNKGAILALGHYDIRGVGIGLKNEEQVYLGYEMGLNPISTEFSEQDGSEDITWVLEKTAHRGRFGEVFNGVEMSEFKDGATLEWSKFEKGKYDSIISYDDTVDTINYNEKLKSECDNDISTNNERIKNLVGDNFNIDNLPSEEAMGKGDLGNYGNGSIMDVLVKEINELQKKLNAFGSNTKTTEYEQINTELNDKMSKLMGYRKEVENLASDNQAKEQNKTEADVDINKANEDKDKTILLLKDGDGQYFKTNALYFYKDDSKIVSASTAADAYANYAKLNRLKEYDSKDEAEKQFIGDNNDLGVCFVKTENGVEFYKLEIATKKSLIFKQIDSKKKFSKSDEIMAKCGNTEANYVYCVKYNGSIYEFNSEEDAINCIKVNKLLPVSKDVETFKKSKDVWCQFEDNSLNFGHKSLVEIKEEDVIEEIKKNLPTNEDDILDKYFKTNMYGSYEIASKNEFGMFQIFYSKGPSEAPSYKSFQDFVINSNVPKETFDMTNNFKGVTGSTIDGETKTIMGSSLRYEKGIYHYPFDNDKQNEAFKNGESYTDLNSFGLNSTYEAVKKHAGDENITCSFGEFFAGYNDDAPEIKQFVLDCERAVLSTLLNVTGETLETKITEAEERIAYISNVFGKKTQTNKDLIKITKAEVRGDASSDGGYNKNINLSNDRAKSFAEFLKEIDILKDKVNPKLNEEDNDGDRSYNKQQTIPDFNASDIESKKGRNVKVSIIIGSEDEAFSNRDELVDKINNDALDAETMANYMREGLGYRRYDDERLFFEMLSEKDNIAYSKLIDKVKYFSPAFHSITPEGFNARLTFLHQCTRQGPTVTVSDIGGTGNTAANLAFGRAPFCVLRLGDFLNTKIVINSMSISYPDNQWDINPEGIGMQFMMAKVSLNIDILGGSDISAPIKRLQNAVSFNYYANTSIYDNRSDIAMYDGKNGIDDVRQWNPVLLTPKGGN